MNEEAAFIATLVANPSDQTAALVFADWLDERNDPRGPMLRIDEVRAWMAPTYTNPIPGLIAALETGKKITQASKVLTHIGEPAVPGLVGLLGHANHLVRLRAAKVLRAMGPRAKEALPALLAMVKEKDYEVRREVRGAVKTLAVGGSVETAKLREALSDTDQAVRHQAASLLGSMRAKKQVKDELAKGLDDPDPARRLAVLAAINTLHTKTAVGSLCKALTDPDVTVRRTAAQQLRGLAGPTSTVAVEPLARAISDADPAVRQAALHALCRIGPPAGAALPALLRHLPGAEPQDRPITIQAIGQVGAGHPESLDAVLAALGDPDAKVRAAAGQLLSKWHTFPTSATSALLGYLRDTSSGGQRPAYCLLALARIANPPPEVMAELRARLAEAHQSLPKLLESLGTRASELLPDLIAAFQPSAGFGAGAIAAALGNLGGAGLTALVRGLDHGLGEKHNPFRAAAAAGLKTAGPAALAVLPDLLARLRQPVHNVNREALIRVISAMGPGAASAIPELLAAVTDEAMRDRFQVIGELKAFGPALVPFVPQLVEFLRQPPRGPMGHQALIQLLSGLATHGVDVLGVLRETLRQAVAGTLYAGTRTNPQSVALYAVGGIGDLGPTAAPAIPDLLAAAEAFADARRPVIVALGKIGHAALPHIHAALNHRDWSVRQAAVEALERTGDTSPETIEAIRAREKDTVKKVRNRATTVLKRLTRRPGNPA